MSFTKFPNGVSSYGLPVVGGAHVTTGNVFLVDSNTGSGSYNGLDKDHPFATVTQALAKCTANRGDIIYVMPSHVEPADINVNKAGVSIIGIGHGGIRPKFSLVTNTSASIEISSCDVLIENIIFTTTQDALFHPVEVLADNFTCIDCEWFSSNSTSTPETVIQVASTANNLTLKGFWCGMPSTLDDVGCVVQLLGDSTGTGGHVITDNFMVMGQAATSNGAAGVVASCCNCGYETLIANNVMCVISSCSSGVNSVLGITTGGGSGLIVGNYFGQGGGGDVDLWFGNSAMTDATHDYGFSGNLFGILAHRGASSVATILGSCSD